MEENIKSDGWPFWGMLIECAFDEQSLVRELALDASEEDPDGEFKLAVSVCLAQVAGLSICAMEEIAVEMRPYIDSYRVASRLKMIEQARHLVAEYVKVGGDVLDDYPPGRTAKISPYSESKELFKRLYRGGEGAESLFPQPERMPYLTAWPKLASQECHLNAKAVYGPSVILAVLVLMDICRAIKIFVWNPEKLGPAWDEYNRISLLVHRRALQLTQLSRNGITESELRLEASQNADKLIREHISQHAQRAARVRHAGNYKAKDRVFEWMDRNHHRYSSLDAAAGAIFHGELVDNSVAVIRRWLTQWKRLHAARTVDTLPAD